MRKRSLLIGRFNPFHNGHLKAIKVILKESDELIIVIGSIQLSHSTNNPFTAGERITMIQKSLREDGLPMEKIFIIPAMDMNRNAIYVSHIESFVPKFDIIYSNNPLIRRLFLERGYKVKSVGPYKRKEYQGKFIRERMVKNEEWEVLVPDAVVKYITEIKGLERFHDLIDNKEDQK